MGVCSEATSAKRILFPRKPLGRPGEGQSRRGSGAAWTEPPVCSRSRVRGGELLSATLRRNGTFTAARQLAGAPLPPGAPQSRQLSSAAPHRARASHQLSPKRLLPLRIARAPRAPPKRPTHKASNAAPGSRGYRKPDGKGLHSGPLAAPSDRLLRWTTRVPGRRQGSGPWEQVPQGRPGQVSAGTAVLGKAASW